MTNVQIYVWIGVPFLTVLIGIKILVDYLLHRALIARLDKFDACAGGKDWRPEASRGTHG